MASRDDGRTTRFVALTPERVLTAVEAAGLRVTGVCYPLNSFENRVYEVELADRSRVVAKFYRPDRWSRAQILEEHAFLAALAEDDIPVCTVRSFPDETTLARTVSGIYYAVSDRRGGRAPDELTPALARRLGRLIGRMHLVGARLGPSVRPRLDANRYVREPVSWLERKQVLPAHLVGRFADAARAIAEAYESALGTTPLERIHGDLHLGNVLLRDHLLNLLDFDDMAIGPAVQDLWLAAPGRDPESLALRAALVAGYEEFRAFDRSTLSLIEPLRGLRMVRYAGWLARRWDDPAFKVGWPQFGTATYWQEQTDDLEAQVREIGDARPTLPTDSGPVGSDGTDSADEGVLTNKDYFFDWEGD